MLSSTLRGVISQRLIPSWTAAASPRLRSCEPPAASATRSWTRSETALLPTIIAEGAFYGMQTFDQALFAHVQGGRITRENALAAATSPQDFKLLLAAEGRVGTSMADLLQPSAAAPVGADRVALAAQLLPRLRLTARPAAVGSAGGRDGPQVRRAQCPDADDTRRAPGRRPVATW